MSNYRVGKDEYYWGIAKTVAERSTCMCVKGGAIIVKDDQIIATGYVGSPRNVKDCFERGNCFRRQNNIPSGHRYELCRSVHAEQNAIINSARAGVSLLNGTMYLYFLKRFEGKEKFVNAYPCTWCKRTIINSGIKRFVGNDENGKIISYDVEDWTEDWNKNDIIDSVVKYDSKYGDRSEK